MQVFAVGLLWLAVSLAYMITHDPPLKADSFKNGMWFAYFFVGVVQIAAGGLAMLFKLIAL